MSQTITTSDIDLRKCSKCGIEKNLCICLSCNRIFCDHLEEDHLFTHFISTQHTLGMNLKEKKIFCLSPDIDDNDYILNKNSAQFVGYSTDDLILNMNGFNDQLKLDGRSERNVEETTLINIDLIRELEELRHENKNLLTTIDGLVEEKKMLGKEINEIQKDLVHDRLTNKQLMQQLDKSKHELNKLKLEFGEEKAINQQLINNQRELMDQVKKADKEINELKDQVNDLILHIAGAEKLEATATTYELKRSQIVITAKPTRARRRK